MTFHVNWFQHVIILCNDSFSSSRVDLKRMWSMRSWKQLPLEIVHVDCPCKCSFRLSASDVVGRFTRFCYGKKQKSKFEIDDIRFVCFGRMLVHTHVPTYTYAGCPHIRYQNIGICFDRNENTENRLDKHKSAEKRLRKKWAEPNPCTVRRTAHTSAVDQKETCICARFTPFHKIQPKNRIVYRWQSGEPSQAFTYRWLYGFTECLFIRFELFVAHAMVFVYRCVCLCLCS